MNDPYEVLGLSRGCSLGEVRAAYARLLKQHRPDADPAGFRRLRDAYELLRRLLDPGLRPAGSADRPLPLPGSVPAAAVSASAAADAAASTAADRGAPAAGMPARVAARREAPRVRWPQAVARARANGRSTVRLLAWLLAAWRRDAVPTQLLVSQLPLEPSLRLLLQPEDLLQAMAAGERQLLDSLLQAHVLAGDWPALPVLGAGLESLCRREPSLAAAAALAATTPIVAMLEVAVAERMADAAFSAVGGRLPASESDAWLLAGREVEHCQAADRRAVARLAFGEEVAEDAPEIETVQRLFARLHGRAPMLAHLIAERFPHLRSRIVRKQLDPRQVGVHRPTSKRPPARRGRWPWLVGALLGLLAVMLRHCAADSPPAPPREPPPLLEPGPADGR